MGGKDKSSWAGFFVTALKLEGSTGAGRANIVSCTVNFALAVIIVPTTFAQIVADTYLKANGREPLGYIPGWLTVSLVVGAVVMPIICMVFLAYADWKLRKK